MFAMMLRATAICTVLCLIAHLGFGAPVEETIFSRVIETRLPNPITVVMDSTLYTISKTNHILSVNFNETICKMIVDPFDENIERRIRAVTLPIARKILVWGARSIHGQTLYTLLVVDPLTCSHKVVPLPDDISPWIGLAPQIVVNDDTFHVFYPSHQVCAPCSFDFNGRNTGISKNRQLRPQSAELEFHYGFHIKGFHSESYKYLLHVYNFQSGGALIELVDDYWFKSKTAVYLNQAVQAISVAYGSYQNTAICYILDGVSLQVTCSRLDSRLVPGMTWELPMGELIVLDVFVEVDEMGNTFIGTIDFHHQLRFFVYNMDGLLAANLDFGQLCDVDERFRKYEVNGIRLADEYCLEAVTYEDDDAQETRHAVKCVDVKKYIQ